MENAVKVKKIVPENNGRFNGNTSGASLLDRLAVEKGGTELKLSTRQGKAVARMRDAYGKFLGSYKYDEEFGSEGDFRRCCIAAQELGNYGPKEIEFFSMLLGEYEPSGLEGKDFARATGLFLSALVKNCQAVDFRIVTDGLGNPPSLIGYKNSKYITVVGDVGDATGHWMWHGEILVKGNAGHRTGRRMEAGRIIIEGDAGQTGYKLGEKGTVIIHGNVQSLNMNECWGKIYQRDRLLVSGHMLLANPENK